MSKLVTGLGLASALGAAFFFVPMFNAAAESVPISDMHFDINTKGDDKDRGEHINIQVIKDNTVSNRSPG